MGATPYSDANGSGVRFRVWAPFAGAVAVAGEFNGWSTSADPLFSEGNDYWSVDLASAGVDDQYKFVVSTAGPPWRLDPYARSIIHDANGNLNGLIATSDEAYATPGYSTPPWNELVIYEMHYFYNNCRAATLEDLDCGGSQRQRVDYQRRGRRRRRL